jgi:peptide/nickel transport system ATP-binding protein
MSALEVQGLGKRFPLRTGLSLKRESLAAVSDVSFTLEAGKVTALVGESGSGKSTVARMLSRLYPPTEGKILFDGEDVSEHGRKREILDYRSKVQMIFQDPFSSLNPVKRIDHHIARPLQIHGIRPRGGVEARVYELLQQVGLIPPEEIAMKYPHQLSGGQRQRVAIARALAVEPSVILCDEPISMLDVSIRVGILNLILQLKHELRIAFLYITHDIASARYVADEVLVMYAGQIVEQANVLDLYDRPEHPYTEALLGALPQLEGAAAREGRLTAIPGRPPDLVHPPAACRFAPRCPYANANDSCAVEPPELRELRPGHWVRSAHPASARAGQPVVAAKT